MHNGETSFIDHLCELRSRILTCLAAIVVLAICGYYLFPRVIRFLTAPLGEDLYVLHITEAFLTRLKVAIFTGVVLALPLIVYEFVMFVLPALKKREREILLGGILGGGILFFIGVVFSYDLILPLSIKFLKSKQFFLPGFQRQLVYGDFVTFVFQFLLAFGLAFQFPVILLILMKLSILKRSTLKRNFRYVIVLCFAAAALLTPPDIISQILLALPLIGLYGLAIFLAHIFKLGET